MISEVFPTDLEDHPIFLPYFSNVRVTTQLPYLISNIEDVLADGDDLTLMNVHPLTNSA